MKNQANELNFAVQYAPFDALSGYADRIRRETELPEEERERGEEGAAILSRRLRSLKKGDTVSVTYFSEGHYRFAEGKVAEADSVFRRLRLLEFREPIDYDTIWSIAVTATA